jgi:hypothetical protein
MTDIDRSDCELIIESLRYTRQAFEGYEHYPSEEFRRERIADVDSALTKIRALRKGLPR